MTTSKPMMLSSALLALTLTSCGHITTADEQVAATINEFTEQKDSKYQHAFFDLNSDGVEDVLVLLESDDWCGSGGCTLLVLEGQVLSEQAEPPVYKIISQSTVTRTPISVADSESQNWHDLIVHSGGEEKILKFDGQHYPHNASMQPAATDEQRAGAKTVLP